MEMTERKKKILAAVVERYILSGEPVGSKAHVDLPGLSVSSATVRNDMADLVTAGYLEQPHTSAGRIPSSEGYRYYVDNLMGRYELSDKEKRIIDSKLEGVPSETKRTQKSRTCFIGAYWLRCRFHNACRQSGGYTPRRACPHRHKNRDGRYADFIGYTQKPRVQNKFRDNP